VSPGYDCLHKCLWETGAEGVNKEKSDANKSNSSKNEERWKNLNDEDFTSKVEVSIANSSNISGVFYPEPRSSAGFVVYQADPEQRSKPLGDRIPPTALRHYYGLKDGRWHDDIYLQGGAKDVAIMKRILAADGFATVGERILELGCSAGRLLRHLGEEAEAQEVWGVDLHSAAIHWAQAYLSPPFHFCLTTTNPHLPFEDRSFGLVFAGSVWTHIGELDDAWLLEIRRILRVGGRLYLTFSDEETLAEIERLQPNHPSVAHVAALHAETGMLDKPYYRFVTRTTPWLQRAVYNRAAWVERLSRWFDVGTVKPKAYGWQTAIVLSKRG
jgi:ubiquinone/menaquinone biosynthesis C-methylase UbiE